MNTMHKSLPLGAQHAAQISSRQLKQGILTEGEGSVRSTSSLRYLLTSNCMEWLVVIFMVSHNQAGKLQMLWKVGKLESLNALESLTNVDSTRLTEALQSRMDCWQRQTIDR
jgi:hypothetical protein